MPFHYVMLIAYKGTHFFGWQKTDLGPSIESSVTAALQQITQEPIITLQAASRTDRGVHAVGQVVDFYTEQPLSDLHRTTISVNQLLPSDIVCRKMLLIDDDSFHPTLSSIGKRYEYSITTGQIPSPFDQDTSWHIFQPLDQELMKNFMMNFYGTHDFYGYSNYRKGKEYTSTIRTIHEISLVEKEKNGWNMLTFSIAGDNFLYKMVRNLVGTIVWVGAGKLDPQDAIHALYDQKRELKGVTAPALGLSLIEVLYPTKIFTTK